jgi:hypothetical protein
MALFIDMIKKYENKDNGDGYIYNTNDITEIILKYKHDNKQINLNKFINNNKFSKTFWEYVFSIIIFNKVDSHLIKNIFKTFENGDIITNNEILVDLITNPLYESNLDIIFDNIDNGYQPTEMLYDNIDEYYIKEKIQLYNFVNDKKIRLNKLAWINKKNIKNLYSFSFNNEVNARIFTRLTDYLLTCDKINIETFKTLYEEHLDKHIDKNTPYAYDSCIKNYLKFLLKTNTIFKVGYIYYYINGFIRRHECSYETKYIDNVLGDQINNYLKTNNIYLDVMNFNSGSFSETYMKFDLFAYIYNNNITNFIKMTQDNLLYLFLISCTYYHTNLINDINFINYIITDDFKNNLIETTITIGSFNTLNVEILHNNPHLISNLLLEKAYNSIDNKRNVEFLLENKCEVTQEMMLNTSDSTMLYVYNKYNYYMTKETMYKYSRINKIDIEQLIKYSIYCNESEKIKESIIKELQFTDLEIKIKSSNEGIKILLEKELRETKPIITRDMLYLINDTNKKLIIDYYFEQNQNIKEDNTKVQEIKKKIKINKKID